MRLNKDPKSSLPLPFITKLQKLKVDIAFHRLPRGLFCVIKEREETL